MAPLTREMAETLANTLTFVRIVDQKDRKIQPRFKKIVDGLQSGIEHASEDEIALYRPQLEKLNGEIDDALNNTQGALRLLAQLRADKQVMETRFEQVEKLVKTVAVIRKRFTEQAAQARKLDHDVQAALATIRKSETSIEAELSVLQSQMKALMKTIGYVDAEVPTLEKAARAAFEKKDQKALTQARTTMIDWMQVGPQAAATRRDIDKFRTAHPDLDRERKAEVQTMLDDIERATDSVKRLDKTVRELVALGQVAHDAQKAPAAKLGASEVDKIVTTFGVDAKAHGAMRGKAMKIVNSLPLQRWPAELAKLYGAKEADLKAKLGSLMKLPFVKPLALIDI